jgi:hypothetical protein
MLRDQIFRERGGEISDFNFGEKTAAVFDDVLDRSALPKRKAKRNEYQDSINPNHPY